MNLPKKKVAVLGSTGSVGEQALDVCAYQGYGVTGIAAGKSVKRLEEQIRRFRPAYCAVADKNAAADLKVRVADTDTVILSGENAAEELASLTDADTVLNAVTGFAGLRPTVAAIRAGKDVALANKETMVAFGELVMALVAEKGVKILPVDSEHCAIFQCLRGNRREDVRRLIITASGGPFYGKTKEELSRVTAENALAHPTWSMGKRITIDSSTLMNKGFEVIEAVRLFGVSPEKIDVVIHRESIIHSMVEYNDSAVIAQMALPDMRLCVQYALTCPDRVAGQLDPIDFTRLGSLTFAAPDADAFPLLPLAFEAVKEGGIVPAAMNAADEVAVSLFLAGKIGFLSIPELVTEVTRNAAARQRSAEKKEMTLAEVEEADRAAREETRSLVG